MQSPRPPYGESGFTVNVLTISVTPSGTLPTRPSSVNLCQDKLSSEKFYQPY